MTSNAVKRCLTLVLALVLALCPLLSPRARASEPALSAKCAVLLDEGSGRFLVEKNPRDPMLIASCTKMMTALVVLNRCNLDAVVTVQKEQTGVEGSSMYLKPDEQLTVRELLYGLLLSSGNDAAEVLAVYCAGSIPAFADLMNEQARALELVRSHFANPHGLNANQHYSCARDLALVAREALKNEEFRRIVSTKNITVAGRALKNHNKLLWDYPGTVGIKTGYTIKAGRCLVSAAERDGRLLIAVTLNAPDDWKDHTALFDAGFTLFQSRSLCRIGEDLGKVPVLSGTARSVPVYARTALNAPLTDEEFSRVELSLRVPWYVWAPVTRDVTAGTARWMLDGKLIAQTELYYGEVAEQAPHPKTLWQSLSEFFGRAG